MLKKVCTSNSVDMPIYRGKGVLGEDDFEITKIEPICYVSPCGNYWSTEPFRENNSNKKPKSRFHK